MDKIEELGQMILNFTHQIPAGMVVFFPSYNFLNKAKEVWQTSFLEKFGVKKCVCVLLSLPVFNAHQNL